jgi:hypothetical protein
LYKRNVCSPGEDGGTEINKPRVRKYVINDDDGELVMMMLVMMMMVMMMVIGNDDDGDGGAEINTCYLVLQAFSVLQESENLKKEKNETHITYFISPDFHTNIYEIWLVQGMSVTMLSVFLTWKKCRLQNNLAGRNGTYLFQVLSAYDI